MSEEEEKSLPKIESRKIIEVGESNAITVPMEWLENTDLEKGDEVTIVANNELRVAPSSPELTEKLHKVLEGYMNKRSEVEEEE